MTTALANVSNASSAPPGAPRVILLGGGAVVRECFAPALVGLELSAATTIVDARGPSAGTPDGFQRVTADFREYLASLAPGSATHCVVALPNALHYEAVSTALKAGMHVLCEKPLSLDSAECRELAALAESVGRTLSVNMVRRLFHAVQSAAAALEHRWIGRLRAIHIEHGGAYGWPVTSLAPFLPENGGVLADMGVHYLDMAQMLFGPLTPVSYSDDWAGGVESACQFRLATADGVPLELTLSRVSPLSNEILIEGESGTLRLGVDDFQECRFDPPGEGRDPSKAVVLRSPDDRRWSFADYFAEQLRRFVAGTPGVSGNDAAQTAALIEWAYRQRRMVQQPRGAHLEEGRVLVTGATGFIGSHLVGRLASDDTGEITAAFRSFGSCASISRFPVRYHHVDLLAGPDLRAAVRGHRYVFHLAVSRNDTTERRLTVDGTSQLVDACVEEGVEAVVVLSTMYVFGRPDGVVTEDSPYDPIGGAYGTTKAEMERWCVDRARSSGRTRIVVLIPTCVYGPGGDTYTRGPVGFAQEGRFCWIENGTGLANIVYVENLVEAMVLAAIAPAAHGQRFIINDATVDWRDFLTPFLGPWAAGVPSPTSDEFAAMTAAHEKPASLRDLAVSIIRSPEVWNTASRTSLANQLRPVVKKYAPGIVRIRRRANRPAARRPGVQRPLPPPDWLAEVYGPNRSVFSAERARRLLGWTSTVDRAEATRRSCDWLRRQLVYEPLSGK